MKANIIENGTQGRIQKVGTDIHVVSGLEVPKLFRTGELDVFIGLVHDGLQRHKSFMGPATRRQIREDVESGNAVIAASFVGDQPVFEATAFAKPAKSEPNRQEVRSVLGLHRSSVSGVPAEAVKEATWLASMRQPEEGIQALVATSNEPAQRLFGTVLGAAVVGERLSDYVHEDGDKRKPRVLMTIYDMATILKSEAE